MSKSITLLELFITQTARDAGLRFCLDGAPVTSQDLGDPSCLLPLVVATIHSLENELHGSKAVMTDLLAPADPQQHMLGWSITRLPDIPEGALLLLANHALRHRLAHEPEPVMSWSASQVIKSQSRPSELRAHLYCSGLATQQHIASAPSEPSR